MANQSLLKPLGMTGLGEPIASAPTDPDPVIDNPYPEFLGWRSDALGVSREDAITREQGFDYMKMFRSQQWEETDSWTIGEEADALSAQFEFNQRHGLLTDWEKNESVPYKEKIEALNKESQTLRNNDFHFGVIDKVSSLYGSEVGHDLAVGELKGLHEKGELSEETTLKERLTRSGKQWHHQTPGSKPIFDKIGDRAKLEKLSDAGLRLLLNRGDIPFAKLSDGEIYYGPNTARPENLGELLNSALEAGYIDPEDRYKISGEFEIVEGSNGITVVALKRKQWAYGVMDSLVGPGEASEIATRARWDRDADPTKPTSKNYLRDTAYRSIDEILDRGGVDFLDGPDSEHYKTGYIKDIQAAIALHEVDSQLETSPGVRWVFHDEKEDSEPNRERETKRNIRKFAANYASLSDKEITDWLYKQVLTREASMGTGAFAEFDEDDLEKSIVRWGDKIEGELVVHPKAFLRNESFDALVNSDWLTDYEKAQVKDHRKTYYEQLYVLVNKAHETALTSGDREVWEEAKLQHAVENGEREERGEKPLSDGEFLRSLVNDPDYYDAYDTKKKHLGMAAVDGFSGVVSWVASSLVGGKSFKLPGVQRYTFITAEEFGHYGSATMDQQQSRRLMSATFGRNWLEGEMGGFMTVGEVLIPLVTDLVLGAVATVVTGGAGGVAVAGYTAARIGGGAAAKQTVKLAAKAGIKRQVATNLMTEAATAAAKGPAALGNGLLKNAVKSASGKAAIDAGVNATAKQVAAGSMKPFWKTVGDSFTAGKAATQSHKATRVIAGAMAPAFARSASSHYTQVYASLPAWMSHEEKHAKAMGAGLVGGAITAILTGGFSAFGAGGLERILEHKAGGKIIGQVLGQLRQNGQALGHVESRAVVMRILERGIKNNQVFRRAISRFAPDAIFEGIEESLDTLISSPVIDKMLRRQTNWGEVLDEAMMSFAMGALVSGVAGSAHAGWGGVFRGDTQKLTTAYTHTKVQSLIEELEKAGSPATAKEFRKFTQATLLHGSEWQQRYTGRQRREGAPVHPVLQPRRGEGVPKELVEMGKPLLAPESGIVLPPALSGDEQNRLSLRVYDQIEREEKHRHFDRYRRMEDFSRVEQAILKAAQQLGVTDVTELDINDPVVQELLPSLTAQEDIDAAKIDPAYNVTDSGVIIGMRNPSRKAGVDWVGVEPTPEAAAAKLGAYRESLPESVKQGRAEMEEDFAAVLKELEVDGAISNEELDAILDELEDRVTPESIERIMDEITKVKTRVARIEKMGKKGTRAFLISVLSEGDDQSVVSDPAIVAAEQLKSLPDADTIANELDDPTAGLDIFDVPSAPLSTGELVKANTLEKGIPATNQQIANQLDVDANQAALEEEAEARDTNPTGQKDPKKKKAEAEADKNKRDAEQRASSKANLKANEFIDDKLAADEIKTFNALVSAGEIVELASGEHGLPVRKKYPSDYYTKKTNLLEHRINKKYPKLTIKRKKGRAGVKGKDGKVVRKADGTPAGHVEDGIGVFNNDPETVAFLFSRGIPVRVPPDFKGLNPSIIVNENGLVSKVLIGGKEVSIGRVNEPLPSPKGRATRTLRLLEIFHKSAQELGDGVVPLYDAAGNVVPPAGLVQLNSLLDGIDNFFVANSDEVSAIVNGAPSTDTYQTLSDSGAAYATVSAQLEAKLVLQLFALRERIIKSGNVETKKTKKGEEYLAPTDGAVTNFYTSSAAFTEIANRPGASFGDLSTRRVAAEIELARTLSASTDVQGDPESEPKEVIKSFLTHYVLNNTLFSGGVPPIQETVARTRNYYQFLESRMTREARIKAWKAARTPLDTSNVPAGDRKFSGLVDPIKASRLPKRMSSVLIGLTDAALDDIRTNAEARGRLNSFLSRSVFAEGSEDFVSSLSADNAVGVLLGWATSSPSDNTDLNTFYDYLEASPDSFGNNSLATLLRLYWTGSDAHLGLIGEDTNFLERFARLSTQILRRPTPLSAGDISAAVAAIRSASVEYFSHSYATGLNQSDIVEENLAEIGELGLVAGDPDTVVNAFRIIAEKSDNQAHKLAARILLKSPEFIGGVKFIIDSQKSRESWPQHTRYQYPAGLPAGMFSKPGYGPYEGVVTLFVQGHSGDADNIATTLLHEYLHAFTDGVWWSQIYPEGHRKAVVGRPYKGRTPEQEALLDTIDSLRKEIRAAIKENNLTSRFTEDALSRGSEFIPRLFTSRNLQSIVASLPPAEGELSLLKRALNAFFDLINLGIQYLTPEWVGFNPNIAGIPLFKPEERNLYAEAFESIISFAGSVEQPHARAIDVRWSATDFTYGLAERTDEFVGEAADIFEALKRTTRSPEPELSGEGLQVAPEGFTGLPKPTPAFVARRGARIEGRRAKVEQAIREELMEEIRRERREDPLFAATGRRTLFTISGSSTRRHPHILGRKSSITSAAGTPTLTEKDIKRFTADIESRLSQQADLYDLQLRLVNEPGADYTGKVDRDPNTGELHITMNLPVLIATLAGDNYFGRHKKPVSMLVDAVFAEEVIHYAAIQAIPAKVFDALLEDTTAREFADIARWYHGQDPMKGTTAADETIKLLDSDDPKVSIEAKRAMLDEFLRMQVQKRMKGMTTEEMRQYFRGVDALVSPFYDNKNISRKEKSKWRKSTTILWGLKNAYRRYVVHNKFARNNPRFKQVIDNIADEVKAMEGGYRYNPGTMAFDPANPADTFYAIKDQLASTDAIFDYETKTDTDYRNTLITGDSGKDDLNEALGEKFSLKEKQQALRAWSARNPKAAQKMLAHLDTLLKRAGFGGSVVEPVLLDKNGKPVDPSARVLPSEGEMLRSSIVADQIESDRKRYRIALNGDNGDDMLQEHVTTALDELNVAFESGEEIRWKGVALGEFRIFGPQQFWKRYRKSFQREAIRQLDLPYPADPDMVHKDWALPELEEGQEDLTLEQYKEFLAELPEGDPRKSYDLDGAMERFRSYVKQVVTERTLYDTRRDWEIRNPASAKVLREVLDYEYLHKGHTKLSTLELKNANDLIAARDQARADLAFSRDDIGHTEAKRLNKFNWSSDDVGYLHWWHGYRGYQYEGNLQQHVAPGAEGREWASLSSSENYAASWGPAQAHSMRRHLSFGENPDRIVKGALKMLTPEQRESLDEIAQEFVAFGFQHDTDLYSSPEENIINNLVEERAIWQKTRDLSRLDAAGDIDRFFNKTLRPSLDKSTATARRDHSTVTRELEARQRGVAGSLFHRLVKRRGETVMEFAPRAREFRERMAPQILTFLRNFRKNRFTISIGGKEFNAAPVEVVPYYAKPTKASYDFSAYKSDAEIIKNIIGPYYDGREEASRRIFNQVREALSSVSDATWDEATNISPEELATLSGDSFFNATLNLRTAKPHPFYNIALRRIYFGLNIARNSHFTRLEWHEITAIVAAGKDGWEAVLDSTEAASDLIQAEERVAMEVDDPTGETNTNLLTEFKLGNYRMWESHFFLDELKADSVRMQEYESELYQHEPVNLYVKPGLLKSGYAVTFDDNGQIIDPSERMDFTKDNIRFSSIRATTESIDSTFLQLLSYGDVTNGGDNLLKQLKEAAPGMSQHIIGAWSERNPVSLERLRLINEAAARAGNYTLTRNEYISDKGDDPVPTDTLISDPLGGILLPFARFRVEEVPLSEQDSLDYRENRGELAEQKKLVKLIRSYKEEQASFIGDEFEARAPSGIFADPDSPFGYGRERHPLLKDINTKAEVKDAREWKQVGGQLGSNKGGIFEDENGTKHYFKESKTPDHARNEVLASVLYELAGAEVVPLRLAIGKDEAGEDVLGTASEWREGLRMLPRGENVLREAYKDFAAHAWLANWDVVGTGYDNLLLSKEGKPVHVDPGGALQYRAQGAPKGENWNDEASEFESLRTRGTAGEIFGRMTHDEIKNSTKRLFQFSDSVLRQIVDSVFQGSEGSEALADTLIARRKNIIKKAFDVSEAEAAAPVLRSSITPEQDALYLELAQDEEANREELQKMVDEWAKENGYLIEAYHAGPEEITIFDAKKTSGEAGAFFFADSEEAALNFANTSKSMLTRSPLWTGKEGENPQVVRALLRIENPKEYENFWIKFNNDRGSALGSSLYERLENLGHDGITIGEDVWADREFVGLDEEGKSIYRGKEAKGKQYVVLNRPENIKSSEPVTRDAAGNVIPLSERYNRMEPSVLRSSIRPDFVANLQSEEDAEISYWRSKAVRAIEDAQHWTDKGLKWDAIMQILESQKVPASELKSLLNRGLADEFDGITRPIKKEEVLEVIDEIGLKVTDVEYSGRTALQKALDTGKITAVDLASQNVGDNSATHLVLGPVLSRLKEQGLIEPGSKFSPASLEARTFSPAGAVDILDQLRVFLETHGQATIMRLTDADRNIFEALRIRSASNLISSSSPDMLHVGLEQVEQSQRQVVGPATSINEFLLRVAVAIDYIAKFEKDNPDSESVQHIGEAYVKMWDPAYSQVAIPENPATFNWHEHAADVANHRAEFDFITPLRNYIRDYERMAQRGGEADIGIEPETFLDVWQPSVEPDGSLQFNEEVAHALLERYYEAAEAEEDIHDTGLVQPDTSEEDIQAGASERFKIDWETSSLVDSVTGDVVVHGVVEGHSPLDPLYEPTAEEVDALDQMAIGAAQEQGTISPDQPLDLTEEADFREWNEGLPPDPDSIWEKAQFKSYIMEAGYTGKSGRTGQSLSNTQNVPYKTLLITVKDDNTRTNKPHFGREVSYPDEHIVAHIRLTERTTLDGKLALHIEEIQSDWASATRTLIGTSKNLNGLVGLDMEAEGMLGAMDAAKNLLSFEDAGGFIPGSLDGMRTTELGELMSKYEGVPRDQIAGANKTARMPKRFTDKYVDIALKRITSYAIKAGKYDYITFPSGAQVINTFSSPAERFNPSEATWEVAKGKEARRKPGSIQEVLPSREKGAKGPYVKLRMKGDKAGMMSAVIVAPLHKENDGITVEYTSTQRRQFLAGHPERDPVHKTVLVSPDTIKEQASKIPIEVRKKLFAKMASIQKSGVTQVFAYHESEAERLAKIPARRVSGAMHTRESIEARGVEAQSHKNKRDQSAEKLGDTRNSLYMEFGGETVENFRKLTYMMTAWEHHLDRLEVARAVSGEPQGAPSGDRFAYTTRAQLERMVGPEILDFIEKEYKEGARNGQLVADKDGNGKPVKMTSKELKRWSGPPISKPEHDEDTGDVIMDERDIGKVPLHWGGRLHKTLYGTMLPAGLTRALGVKEGKGRNTLSSYSGATGQILEGRGVFHNSTTPSVAAQDLFKDSEKWFRREHSLSDGDVMIGLGGDANYLGYVPVSSVDLSAVPEKKAANLREGISLFSSIKNNPTDQSHIPLDIGEGSVNYGRTFKNLLKIPFYHTGDYDKPFFKSFVGELDPRLTMLDDNRSAFQRTVGGLVKNYKLKLDKHLKKSFGSLEAVPSQLLSDAIGSTEGVMLSDDDASAIEDDYQKEIESIASSQRDGSMSSEEARAAYDLAAEQRIKTIHAKELALADGINARKVRALRDLSGLKGGDELVKHIVSLRNLLDDLSSEVKGLYNLSPSLEAHFDANMGIYLTRAYKMFTESDYGRRVMEDLEFLTERETAAKFFRDQYRATMVERLIGEQKMSQQEANEVVDAEFRKYEVAHGSDLGMDAAREYVESFEYESGKAKKMSEASPFRPMIQKLKRKKAIDPALRGLLGEYDKSTNLDNLFRTITTVGNMASNQAFLRHAVAIGRESKWLHTKPELDKLIAEARENGDITTLEKLKGYIPVRGREHLGGSARAARHDPFTNYINQDGVNKGELFGPPELAMGLKEHFAPMTQEVATSTAEKRLKWLHKFAARATGLSMASKTLGSAGFYVRNALSNMLFFAPMQGLRIGFGATSLFKELSREVTGAEVDNYRVRLHGLGIIGDDVNTNLVSDLINGNTSEEAEFEKLERLLKKSEDSLATWVRKTAGRGVDKGLAKGKKVLWDIPLEKAKQISLAIDAAHKIAYFESELDTLKKARDEANRTSDGSIYQGRSDEELDGMAAKNILMTSQSYSQTMPIVKGVQKSWLGVMYSPFLRFKTEVPRITYNTFKLAFTEMRSGNDVIYWRGVRRLSGAIFTLGGLTTGASLLLKAMLGYGDDEDQASRSGVPEYSRGHTFFFFGDDEKTKSADLTFVNPFAVIADPFLRGFEHLIAGRPEEIAGEIASQLVFETFMDEQILWGTLRRALWDKEDPTTGHPLYEKTDSPWTKLEEITKFVYRDAFEPKSLKAIFRAADAVGEDYEDWEFTPLGILAQELRPFKVHTLNPPKMFKRYLGETQDSYRRIRNKKGLLLSPRRRFDEEEIREIVRNEYRDIRRIHDDINRKIRGYEGLGLPYDKAFPLLKGMKISTERLHMLNQQATGRINPQETWVERILNDEGLADEVDEQGNVLKKGEGRKRLEVFIDELRKLPSYDPIPSALGEHYLSR